MTRRFPASWCCAWTAAFFATAQALEDRIRELSDAEGSIRAVVLDFEAVPFIDSQGAEQLSQIQQLVSGQGATLRLGRVKPHVMAVLERDAVIDRIGADHVHGNIHRAVEAELAADRLRV